MAKREFVRRNEEELEQFKKESRINKFILKPQPGFKGSQELLDQMRDYERSYREGKPKISDQEWDMLIAQTGYEESLDDVVSANGRRWHKLGAPLGSLNKINSLEKLDKFIDKLYRTIPDFKGVIVSPKLDGLTFNAVYKSHGIANFKLEFITTRGDGRNGLCLNDDALKFVVKKHLPEEIDIKCMDLLPKLIQQTEYGFKIELSGEAVANRHFWGLTKTMPAPRYKPSKENLEFLKEQLNKYVYRSIPAGMFNRKEPNSYKYIIYKILGVNLEEFKGKVEFDNPKIIKLLSKKFNFIANNIQKVTVKDDKVFCYTEDSEEFELFSKLEEFYKDIPLAEQDIRLQEEIEFFTFGYADNEGNRIDDKFLISELKKFSIGEKPLHPNEHLSFPSGYIQTSQSGMNKDKMMEQIIGIADVYYGTKNFERDFSLERLKTAIYMQYPIDGIVIKSIGSNTQTQKMYSYEKAGKIIVPKYPEDQVALKLPIDPSRTKVLKILFKKTKLGNETVSCEIEPVRVEGGSLVQSVNLHNPVWLSQPENSWIKDGAEANLYLGNDIIPILKPINE